MKPSGRVIWITGLSGAGKSTLAQALLPHLPGAILLDGDDLRAALGTQTMGFDVASRKSLAQIYARLAALLARQGFTVIVATISLFHEVHAWNREYQPSYVEIFLDVLEEKRRRRDPKGLYAAEAKGTLRHMAGSEIAVELPMNADLRLSGDQSLECCVMQVLELLK